MLYDAMLNGGVSKKAFSLEHGINERSFDRDVEDIRLFLSESYSCEELLFDREDNTYSLSGSRAQYMDRMEATIIAKIMLESGVLRKDEMFGLLETLLSAVTPRDARSIEEYLAYDFKKYKTDIDVPVLKFVEDLCAILKTGRDIKITIQDISQNQCTEKISPLELKCEGSTFQLVAAKNYDLRNIVIINMQDVIKFEILFSDYARKLKETYYQEREEHENEKSSKNTIDDEE